MNISNSSSRAYVPTGITITAGGALTLRSSANTDAAAKGDGNASTNGGSAAIGVGVAVNLANVVNEAVVETGAVVVSHGLTADATMTDRSGDVTHRFAAESSSGGGGGDVGIAGSVSINIVNVTTTGAIRTGASVDATGGDIALGAASTSVSNVAALPGGVTSGDGFGLGASRSRSRS